jgi:uncharacterized membrane protein
MKGFIKFVSIVMFGFFCFVGGVAKESGNRDVAVYCVIVGVVLLLHGFSTVTEMETNEIIEKNRKKTDELLKKIKKMGRKLP